MSLKIFIDTGLANEGTGTVIDNGQSDKIEASYNNGRVSITVLQEQGMGARDLPHDTESTIYRECAQKHLDVL